MVTYTKIVQGSDNNGIVNVSVSDSHQYLIQKIPVYPDGAIRFGDTVLGNIEPIRYEIVLKENAQKKVEKEENNYSR